MAKEITLFDLPSRDPCKCWSLNPWKVRLALNYKGLPYKTEWTEYPDLKPKLSAAGVKPNPEGTPAAYSSPAVRMPNGEYIMESLNIVRKLEEVQPEPSLHLDNGYVDRIQAVVLRCQQALVPIAMPRIPERVLSQGSVQYFNETRAKRVGMPLPELAKSEKAKNAWVTAEEPMNELKALLHENSDGPYIMGKTVSFADFVLAGFWRFLEILDDNGDLFGRAMRFDESFPKQYEACKKWLERDD